MKNKICNKIINPFLYFIKSESISGFILLICTIVAIIIANSSFAETYENILYTNITIGYKEFSISMSALHWINDGLMTIFFLVVGMEIKRVIILGELKALRKNHSSHIRCYRRHDCASNYLYIV